MNYHPTNDFPINLEHVFKMIGFANKGNATKTIKSNFVLDEDYRIVIFRTEKNPNSKDLGGRPIETIMLNVDTFKNLCMIAKTDKGKEIRKYYVKLENIYNKIIKEEIEEQRILQENTTKLLEEKEYQLKEQAQLLEQLENKPDTEGFYRNPGYIYLVRDISKPGHYKIGYTNDPQKRINQLNTGSSTYSLEIVRRFNIFDKEFAEKTIHYALQPLKIKNRKDESMGFDSSAWFYLKNKFELAYAIKTIKECLIFVDKFNINNYENLKKTDINIQEELNEIDKDNELKLQIKQENKEICKRNAQQFTNKTGNYKGVCWVIEKGKWKAELKKSYTISFLGYFESELEAAKAYNDYATYLNKTTTDNYSLNNIENYISNPRDIPSKNKELQLEYKSSKYNGVSYNSQRKYYVASIKFNKKTYNLGHHINENECAIFYNQQALYFNNNFHTAYVLNDIPNYITIAKNIYKDIQDNKISAKSSKFYGVTLNKKNNKYRSLLVHNKKQINLGFFTDEIDAAKAYNIKALELNQNFNGHYKINVII
jgi:phage anti-repressor protein